MSTVLKAVAVGLLLAVYGCAGADDGHPPSVSDSESDAGADTSTDTQTNQPKTNKPSRRRCESGTVKECTIYLKAQGAVQNCYPGLSVCDDDGRWSECLSVEDAEGMLESMDTGD